MSTEDNSALPTIQMIMIFILAFLLITYKAENAQLRHDLEQLQSRCQELTQEVESGH